MEKTKKLEIPADVSSMRIKHVHFLTELGQYEERDPTDAEVCRMNALFTGFELAQIKRFNMRDNRKLFNEIVKAYGTYQPVEKVPESLTYPNPDYDEKKKKQVEAKGGTYPHAKEITYTVRMDFTKLPTDWFIDLSVIDFDVTPVDMMSLLYIEKGMTYGQVEEDGSENIINPRYKRNLVFSEHVPLSLFLDVQGFFLKSWSVLEPLLIQAQQENERRKREKRSKSRK